MSEDNSDHDSRTVFCANLVPEVTEELMYELFLQSGPIERVSIPKDKDGNGRGFGFITYRHQVSVPYALSVYSGTRLFGRELRLQNRTGNARNSNGNSNGPREQRRSFPSTQSRSSEINESPNPFVLPNALQNLGALTNPLANAAKNSLNNMTPKAKKSNQSMPNVPAFDIQQLLAQSIHLMASTNGSFAGGSNDNQHNSQSKMTRRQENRPHNKNSNSQYSRDRDRNQRDRRDRSRDRSPQGNWMRNDRRNSGRDNRRRNNNKHI